MQVMKDDYSMKKTSIRNLKWEATTVERQTIAISDNNPQKNVSTEDKRS